MSDYFSRNAGGCMTKNPSEAISRAMTCLRQGNSALILISGSIGDDSEGLVRSWANTLFQHNCIPENAVQNYELLPILSNGIGLQSFGEELIQNMMNHPKLYYISGFHQYGYSPERTDKLLHFLIAIFKKNALPSPLVLNIPASVYHTLTADYLTADVPVIQLLLSEEGSHAQREPTAETSFPIESVPTSAPKNHLDVAMPWYKQNLALLSQEKKGMTAFLEKTSAFAQLASLPESKRIYWKVQLKFKDKWASYVVPCRLVYSVHFSEQEPEIIIRIDDERFSRFLKERYQHQSDRELGEIFAGKFHKDTGNPSIAVQALQWLIAQFEKMR